MVPTYPVQPKIDSNPSSSQKFGCTSPAIAMMMNSVGSDP